MYNIIHLKTCQTGYVTLVARLGILVATPFFFESPILKQIDLYCKAHYIYVIHRLGASGRSVLGETVPEVLSTAQGRRPVLLYFNGFPG